MFGPPSLTFKVGRSRWQAATGSLFLSLGLAGALGMALSPLHFSPRAVASTFFLLSCIGLAAYWAWRSAPVGALHWDGSQWHWSDGVDHPVQGLAVTLDFQKWVLVRLNLDSARPLWLWLERGAASPNTWMSLRRALVYAARNAISADGRGDEGALP
jgi:hypothetical protein